MQNKPNKNRWLKWLLALNLIGLLLLGGMYWSRLQKQRRAERKQMEQIVNTRVERGVAREDATRILELSKQFESAEGISNADLDWCLAQLKPSQLPPRDAASFRMEVGNVLNEAIPQMSAEQKERLFRAMADEIALDDPQDEIGMDTVGPSGNMARLKDKRAIPILRPLLRDPRSAVRRRINQTLAELESGTAK